MTTRDRKPGEGLADRRSLHPFGTAGAGAARDVQSGSTAWHGVTLTHRGDEIGVVSQVTRSGEPAVTVLHALGGVSLSLEYVVPETSIVGGLGSSSRAEVSDSVEFEPRRLCADGRVILAPRASHAAAGSRGRPWLEMPHSAWTGIRVFADAGYLGIVEATLPAAARPDTVAFLIVHARMPFWKRRLLVIPLSRVVACTPVDSVARVTGGRRELASMSEPDLIARGMT